MSEQKPTKQLAVWLHRTKAGLLSQDENGQLWFQYDREYLKKDNPAPISQSVPLQEEPVKQKRIRGFFEGLLPDEALLDALGDHVGSNQLLPLLHKVGGDLTGAISVLPPGKTPPPMGGGETMKLSDKELGDLLQGLPEEWLKKIGVSSILPGSQPKLSAIVVDGEVCIRTGGLASTHILKPMNQRIGDVVPNEAFCMSLAQRSGLNTPNIEACSANGVSYLLVERYDRENRRPGTIRRLHQEDFCQALGVLPDKRYQRDGGPTLQDCFRLLKNTKNPEASKLNLLRGVFFNMIIGNTDAHGKNFSLLYNGDPKPDMAPLYDLVSSSIYEQTLNPRGSFVEMAMSVGKCKETRALSATNLAKFAAQCDLDPVLIQDEIGSMIEQVRLEAPRLAQEFKRKGLYNDDIPKILEKIDANTKTIERALEHVTRPDQAPKNPYARKVSTRQVMAMHKKRGVDI